MSPLLLVDDDQADAFLFMRALKEAGIGNEIVLAGDAEAAMAAIESRRPCLVLMDQKLPGRSGLEVIEWLRNRSGQPTLPVVLLSASTYDSDVQAAYLVGANGYAVKPATYEQSVALGRAIRDYWLTFNRAPSPR